MNFQRKSDGQYEYVHVGNWINKTINFNTRIQYGIDLQEEPPTSVCSKPCLPGFYKVLLIYRLTDESSFNRYFDRISKLEDKRKDAVGLAYPVMIMKS
jgi:hypothetical protein